MVSENCTSMFSLSLIVSTLERLRFLYKNRLSTVFLCLFLKQNFLPQDRNPFAGPVLSTSDESST